MTFYLVPKRWNLIYIDGTNELDCEKFELPIPKVLSGIQQVAGGELFDFNYGTGAKIVPQPFDLIMSCQAATAVSLRNNLNAFFGFPPTGYYGEIHQFLATAHGGTATYECDAELSSVQYTEDARWYNTNKIIMHGIKATFTPVDLWVVS